MPIGIIKGWIDNRVAKSQLEKEKKAEALRAAAELEQERIRRVNEARATQEREKEIEWSRQVDFRKLLLKALTTDCLSNPDFFVSATKQRYKDAGVDFDAETENGVLYEDLLKKLSPETKKFIENELNEGSIPVLMPGRSELQKRFSLYLEALSPISTAVANHKVINEKLHKQFINGYYYRWGEHNTPDSCLSKDIPDEPYLLLVSQENKVDFYGKPGVFYKRLELLRNRSSKPKTAGVNGVLNLGEFMPAFIMEAAVLRCRHIINCDPSERWKDKNEQKMPRSVSFVDNLGGQGHKLDLPYAEINSTHLTFEIHSGERYGTLPLDNSNRDFPIIPPRYVTRIPLGT